MDKEAEGRRMIAILKKYWEEETERMVRKWPKKKDKIGKLHRSVKAHGLHCSPLTPGQRRFYKIGEEERNRMMETLETIESDIQRQRRLRDETPFRLEEE